MNWLIVFPVSLCAGFVVLSALGLLFGTVLGVKSASAAIVKPDIESKPTRIEK